MAARRVPRSCTQEHVPYLAALLSHPDPVVRGRAASALGRLQDPGALDSLIIALRDGNPGVQHRAVRALGALGDPRAIPPLRYLYPRAGRDLQAAIGEAQREIAAGQAGGR